MGYNRNKKSLALNLQSPEGKDVFKKLVNTADVVVENLRPGAMKKIGLTYNEMGNQNSKLIWALISGFGQLDGYRGPYSERPAFDIVTEAMSGIMHQVGFADKPPSWTIYGMADIYTGMVTSYGVMQALFMREKTGKGQLIDSAMFDNMLSLNEAMVALHSVTKQSPARGKPKNLFPRGAFKTKDGYIALNVPDNIIWERLCKTIQREDLATDKRCKTGVERAANSEYIQKIIDNWLIQFTRAEAIEELNNNGVPTGPINTAPDIFSDPHVQSRKLLMTIEDEEVGTYQFSRTPPLMSASPELPNRRSPKLGEHSESILSELGYKPKEISQLISKGISDTPHRNQS